MHRCLLMVGCGLIGALALCPSHAGDPKKHGFVHKTHKGADGKSKYVVFVPHSYTGEKEYPCILFLHGAGERGDDGEAPTNVGLGTAIKTSKKAEKSFPFFVVFPQARPNPKSKGWQGSDAEYAVAVLDDVQRIYKIDRKRVYLTGFSMGGGGTWTVAAMHPDRWAAIAPICGRTNPKTAEKIKHIPTWCFHGAADERCPVTESREMIAALKKAGGNPIYTEYPGVDHDSWTRTYANPKLYTWLLSHKLK